MTFILPESERAEIAAAPFSSFWRFAFDQPLPSVAMFEEMRRLQLELMHDALKLWLLPFDAIDDAPATEQAAAEQLVAEQIAVPAPQPAVPTAVAEVKAPPQPVVALSPAPPRSDALLGAQPVAPMPLAAPVSAPIMAPPSPAVPALAAAAAMTAPSLLAKPRGQPDDLERIVGIGPKLKTTLNRLGVWHFHQIAAWTPAEVAWVDEQIAFKGRIEREGWQAQASRLAKGATPPKAA